jgi:EAL domain-containing protein (putative c-di-GMP-specific phosphodiesterase class I)/GGDEF domain-containing protein
VRPLKKKVWFLSLFLVFFGIVLILSNVFTHAIFGFDQNGLYFHGPYYMVYMFIPLAFLTIDILYPFIRRASLIREQMLTIQCYSVIIITATLVQWRHPSLLLVSASFVVADFLIVLSFQKTEEIFDSLTGLYGKQSFHYAMTQLIQSHRESQIVLVKISHGDGFVKALGEKFTDNIIIKVAIYLSLLFKERAVYRIAYDTFVLVCSSKEEMNETVTKAKQAFPHSFIIDEKKIETSVSVHYIDAIERLQSYEEWSDVLQLCKEVAKKGESFVGVTHRELSDIRYHKKIEKLLIDAVNDSSLVVNFQPFYDTNKKAFTCAEALVRLQGQADQLLTPSLFLPIAKESVLIHNLDMVMCEKSLTLLEKLKFQYPSFRISCNLSKYDFITPDFVGEILALMSHHDVDPYHLIFELNETIDYLTPHLENTLSRLQASGVNLLMDDFGTGYSNLQSVMTLPFNFYKINRSLLLLCEENQQYQVLIAGLVTAIKAIGKEIIVEGVENEAQARLAMRMGIHLQQGFFYARPLSESDFYALLKNPPTFDMLDT